MASKHAQLHIFNSSKYYRGEKKLKTCHEQPHLVSGRFIKVFFKTTTCPRRPLLSGPKSGCLIGGSAIIRKYYVTLRTAIMQGCECKQTAGKLKASCGKTAMSFSKYFDTLYPPAKKKNLLTILILMLPKTIILLTALIAFPQLHTQI